MKRLLLLLLPLMALSSCGGHDLMLTNVQPHPCILTKGLVILSINQPELPQSTIEANDGKQIDLRSKRHFSKGCLKK